MMQIIPELQEELCGMSAPPLAMVQLPQGSIEAPTVALLSAVPLLEPIEPLDFVHREGMGVLVSPSTESFGQLVPDEVMTFTTCSWSLLCQKAL